MIPKIKAYWPFALAALVFLGWIGFTWRSHHAQHVANQQTTISQQNHEQAIQNAAHGVIHDQSAQAYAAQIAKDADLVAKLRAELARLRARPVPDSPTPGAPDPQPVAPVSDPVLAQSDAVIAAQDKQIQDQEAEIQSLTLSRNSWKTAYEGEAKALVAARLANEARVAAIKASRWQGRFEGFAVGAALGYVGGKL